MLGKKTTDRGSKLTTGPLGVVQIAFAGWDLGLTTAETFIKPDVDTKDIMYQQRGTKAADHVYTGADWILDATFGEIDTEKLAILAPSLFASSGTVGADSGVFKADLNESLLDTIAGVVKAAAVVDQVPSEDLQDIAVGYNAIPIIDNNLINWGVDVQRNLHVQFKLKVRILTSAESTTHTNAFGYIGDPLNEDLPAAVWPDLNAPYITAAEATAATTVVLTLSENATLVGGATAEDQIVVKVDNVFVVPTVVGFATNVVTLTLPAASVAAGQVVEVSVGASTWEDGETTPNENQAVDGFLATNSVV